jgi:hypothetical protein
MGIRGGGHNAARRGEGLEERLGRNLKMGILGGYAAGYGSPGV